MNRKRIALSLVALALVGGAVWMIYGRAVAAPFIFDDQGSVLGNPSIVRLWPLIGDAEQPGPLNPPEQLPTAGRPLVNLSLALNYHFGELDPVGYHIFNLIVHTLSAMLLMAVVQRTLRLEYFGGRFEHASGPLSLLAALLWAVHPLQTETVIYVTQRTELLVGCFYLVTLYGSLRYWAAASTAALNTWLALATLACLGGMASKEVMVTAPVIVLLFERTFVAGSFRRALRQSWPLYLGLILSWGLLLALNYNGPRSNTAGFHHSLPAFAWWLTQTKVLLIYLKLAVWPWPLAIHYELPYLTTVTAAWPWLLSAAVLTVATLVLLWRRNPLGFVGAWVLVILSPTLIVPIVTEVAAERRMYLPLAALVALAVVGGYRLTQQRGTAGKGWPMALAGAVALVLALALSLVSVRRLAAYHDNLTLWQDNAIYQPDDPVTNYNLGNALARADRLQEAIQRYQQALRLKPNLAEANNNLGIALAMSGRLQEAIPLFQRAVQLKPDYSKAESNLGNALCSSGQPEQGIEHYRHALKLKPDDAEANYNLGNVLARTNRLPEAIEQFQQALRLKPDYAEAYASLALAYAESKSPAEAIAVAQKALDLARSQGQTVLAQQIEAWLATHRNDRQQN